MNILILEDSSQSKLGGGQKISLLVAEILKESNKIYSIDFEDDSVFFKKISCIANETLSLESVKVGSKFFRIKQLYVAFKSIVKILKFCKRNKIQIIYATTKLCLLISWIINLIMNLPYVYHSHLAVKNKVISFMMSKAVYVISVSKYIENQIISMNSKIRSRQIYNPVEFRIQPPKNITDKKILNIGYFGTLKEQKGLKDLFQAAKILVNSNVNFFIYGEGEFKFNDIERYSNIFLMGYVDNVDEVLDSIDILMLPSIIPEACPTIIIQAMSKGLPIITTNIGGQNEIVRQYVNGIKVPIKSPNKLVDSISLLSDENLYNQISQNNIRDVLKFPSLEEYKKEIKEIFNDENTSIR